MAQPGYGAPMMGGPAMEPPELNSLKSMLRIARILALIVGIILFIVFLASLAAAIAFASVGFVGAAAFFVIFPIIGVVVMLVVWTQLKEITALVDQGQYQRAKDKTLIWMILGIIFFLIIGIVLLIAYLKFDAVINWQRQQGQPQMGQPQTWAAPMPTAAPMAPPPPMAQPQQPTAAICPKCGKPATWVAQYNRWYCYTDGTYL